MPKSDGLMQGLVNFLTRSYNHVQNLTEEPEQQQMDGWRVLMTHLIA